MHRCAFRNETFNKLICVCIILKFELLSIQSVQYLHMDYQHYQIFIEKHPFATYLIYS